MNKHWLPSHFSLLPCYLHCIWDHCLCNGKQTASHWIWIPMTTFFNILLLFSCPAGVESVDDTTVLGKLDTECGYTGQYIGGKQLISLQGKHHEHRHSKCTKCWQMLYWHTDKSDDIYRKCREWFWQNSKWRCIPGIKMSFVYHICAHTFCLLKQFTSVRSLYS